MDFGFNEEQSAIGDAVREVLEDACTDDRVREATQRRHHDAPLWRQVVDLGWSGLCVPEDAGGLGLGMVEAICVAEPLGYHLPSIPLLPTLAATAVLTPLRGSASADHWLARMAEGTAVGTVARIGADGLALAPYGDTADFAILVGETEVRLVPKGELRWQRIETIDQTRPYARVNGRGSLLGIRADRAWAQASILLCAEMVGIGQRLLDDTVAYVSTRHQFGRPVGSFQAISHKCADMYVALECARSTAYAAAWTAAQANDDVVEASQLAAILGLDAVRLISASAIQSHGGVGFTWEAMPHWWLKRGQLDASMVGSSRAIAVDYARYVTLSSS
jgi:alkylation response protein AidB-like acyl-CoA dehydrogenase